MTLITAIKKSASFFAVFIVSLSQASLAQQSTSNYDTLLQTVCRNLGNSHGNIRLLVAGTGWNPPGPHFMPIRGFNQQEAIPFLLDVAKNGPDWKDSDLYQLRGGILPHIARCYAILCLGYIGDSVAYEFLLDTLKTGVYLNSIDVKSEWKERYDIRKYAAYALG